MAKNQHFFGKIVPLLKAIVWKLCYRFFSSVFKKKGYYLWKCNFTHYALGIRLRDCSSLAINQKNDNDMTSLSNFFEVVLFLLSTLVTGPSFMSILSLVLKLWQFSFIKVWPEIRKSEIPSSEFCPISWDWGELGIRMRAQMALMKYYWMLQSAKVTAFAVRKLIRKK